MGPPFDQVTAYHEAGHAVVALALGRPVLGVSVLPRRQAPGRLRVSQGSIPAVGGLAGTRSADRARRDRRRGPSYRHLRLGQRGPRPGTCPQPGGAASGRAQAERLERRLLAKVEHLLGKEGHWRAVELIAREMVLRGEISGRTARHLFEQGYTEC